MTASDILKIPVNRPDLLFDTIDMAKIKKAYRRLAKEWHPDLCSSPQASDVLFHITTLYERAKYNDDKDAWYVSDVIDFDTISGIKYRFKYKYSSSFELGKLYVSDNHIAYFIDKKYEHFVTNMRQKTNFSYSCEKMRKNIAQYLPKIKEIYETTDYYVVLIKKDKKYVPLRALLQYNNNSIHPKQVCWMVSSLYNIACYLKWAKIVHNDISIDSCLVSLRDHSVLLIGGWWYSSTYNSKLKAMPKRTYSLLPMSIIADKKAKYIIDGQSIKSIARELLGDEAGTSLRMNNVIPVVLVDWALMPGIEDTFKAYDSWMHTVLPEAYGKRQFIKWDVSNEDIYNFHR